ncbi:MAG: hypothetical protein AAGB02_01580 [Pseudomonadota bacterium]
MREYSRDDITLIAKGLDAGDIDYIGLGQFDFQIAFGRVHLTNYHRLDVRIFNYDYKWITGNECEAPIWLLLGKKIKSCKYETPVAFRLEFSSRNFIRFYTEISAYECGAISVSADQAVTKVY